AAPRAVADRSAPALRERATDTRAVARALPTGTVAFVFTDIEGSTALAQRLDAERWSALLGRHREIVRADVGAFDGGEDSTAGDGFFFAFARTADALAATVEAQRMLASEPWPDDT